ncbi:SanA/YdcF family protein [Fusobacterium sp. PH5-44]|uniref:SanA/YdcF family protein n=1 Tax=unclassified Fusobacterium TaxID=2648384 RepID=UPI003D1EA884
MRLIKQFFKIISCFIFIFIAINLYVNQFAQKYIYNNDSLIPKSYTGIVLGAYVWNNSHPSHVLRDRLESAIKLYKNKKIDKILLSGDNGQKEYDEVNVMKNYLLKNGIPENIIFLDHAGFDTYSTMYRAREIFGVKDAIIITQDFHITRSVYLARKNGIDANGYSVQSIASRRNLIKRWTRDKVAVIKAFFNVITDRKPKYLGKKIPITGDNKKSWD